MESWTPILLVGTPNFSGKFSKSALWDSYFLERMALRLPIFIIQVRTLTLEFQISYPRSAVRMASSTYPDQTAPRNSSLVWICTACSGMSVGIVGI